MRLLLPKKKPELLNALDAMVAPAISERNAYQVWWYLVDLYLRGVRNFTYWDYGTGQVEFDWDDEDYEEPEYNGLPFRWEDGLQRVQTEIGRFSRLSLDPSTRKKPHTLESLRNSALSLVMLEKMLEGANRDMVDAALLAHLILYGTVGLMDWSGEVTQGPLSTEWEIVPAWELLCIPAGSSNPSEWRCTARYRVFPLDQLKTVKGFTLPSNESELDIVELPFGTGFTGIMSHVQSSTNASYGRVGSYQELFRTDTTRGDAPTSVDKTDKGHIQRFVRLLEVYEGQPGGQLYRYIARAGRAIVYDEEFGGDRVPYPLGIARGSELGHFYGRSFALKVIPFSARIERLLGKLITSVEDLDQFGFLAYPLGMGMSDESFNKAVGTGPKVVGYEYDPNATRDPIQQVEPHVVGEIAGKVASASMEWLDKLTAQGPIYQSDAPGRVSSEVGVIALADLGSTHLQPIAKSIDACYSTVYRHMLWRASKVLSGLSGESTLELPLSRVDNSMAGVQIDRVSGNIVLTSGLSIDPWSSEIGITSSDPVRKDRRRQEAPVMLKMGAITPLGFTIKNFKEGWDFPIDGESTYENYVKAVLHNLILFGDGQTPGQIEESDFLDKPEVQAYALEEFISTTAFELASQEVQRAFLDRYRDTKALLGESLPPGMPPMEEAAMDQEMSTRAQMQNRMSQMKQAGGQAPGRAPSAEDLEGIV